MPRWIASSRESMNGGTTDTAYHFTVSLGLVENNAITTRRCWGKSNGCVADCIQLPGECLNKYTILADARASPIQKFLLQLHLYK